MARVSICDYCKNISKKDFSDFIELIAYQPNNLDEIAEKELYEICSKCYETLQTLLDSETPVPQIAHHTLRDQDSRDSISTNEIPVPTYFQQLIYKNGMPAPTETLLDHEINKVPSRRDEVVQQSNACKHKYDMFQSEVGDMYMACVKCNEKMNTESIT